MIAKRDRSFESSHLVSWNFLRLACSWLNLELHLGDLRQQRDLIRATRGKIAILEKTIMEAQSSHSLVS